MVVASTAASYRSARLLARNNELVAHTLRSIGELETVLSLVKDAETGYRGFLVTGDRTYLDPYYQATAEVNSHIDRFAELTRNNPGQQRRLPALRQLVQAKLNFARRVIELQQAGNHRAAVALVNSHEGKETMDQIRRLVADMQDEENLLLQARSEQSRKGLSQSQAAFSLSTVVALIFVGGFYFLARREVKERVEAAGAIRERESWLYTTLRSIGDAVIATDATGRVTFLNRVAERLIGCISTECEGKTIPEVFTIFNEVTGEPAPDPVAKAVRDGITELGEHIVLRNAKGEEIPIEDSVAPIFSKDQSILGAVLVFRDVTTKRMAEESARRSEKLAAAGRLAATIAHEINNPLEAATNLVYLARNSASLSDEARQYLDSVDHELARAAHITRKTLSFYRDSSTPGPVNLRALLEEVLAIYGGRIRSKRVRVEKDTPQDLEIVALRGELVQIASNLISNAIDAVDVNGLLKIRVARKSDGIVLEVEDSGPGIAAENVGRIFEPFFTTKKEIGTGLGLWVVKDLVEKQGGAISVVSPSNASRRGARFSVFLPCVSTEALHTPETQVS